MLDKTRKIFIPDKFMLEESGGYLYFNFSFNNAEDIQIRLNYSEAKHLLAELRMLQVKSLVAAEYEQ